MDSRESSVGGDSTDHARAMSRLDKIQSFSARHERNLRCMRSPFQKQDEQLRPLQAKIKAMSLEYERVFSNDSWPQTGRPDDTKPEWARRQIIKIEKLKKQVRKGPDRRSVEEEEARYQARCREEEKQYFFTFLDAFGNLGRGWAMAFYGLHDTLPTADIQIPQSVGSNTSTPSPNNDGTGDIPGDDEWDVPEDVQDPTPLTPCPNTHLAKIAAARKRRISRSIDESRHRKRPCYNHVRGSLAGDRTIQFDQVFQDGRARTKYKIARYPPRVGAFYILSCKEHPVVSFMKNPIIGAAKHLDSASHKHMGRDHEQAIRKLGTRVLGCNDALAAKNNAVADWAIAKDDGKLGRSGRPSHGAPKSRFRVPQVRNTDNIMRIINPGDVCVAHWQKHKGFYPAYILPLGKCLRMRFQKSAILETKLIDYLPSCFEFDPETDSIPRWAPGYEDGGAKVHMRLYPVMFFTNLKFPQRNKVSFVPASHMKPYDKNNENIRYRDQVEDFLPRQYECTPTPSVESRRSSPSKLSTVDVGLGAPSLTMASAANSDRQDIPRRDGAMWENTTPRQQLSPYPEIQGTLERAIAGFGEHAFAEEGHEADGLGDYHDGPRTGETDGEEEQEGMGRGTHHSRDQRQRRKFDDGDTEESRGELEEDDDDIYEDDTLRRRWNNRARSDTGPQSIYTPSASNAPYPRFPNFNPLWQRQSRGGTTESDQQSCYSELLRVGLQMDPTSSVVSFE